MIVHLLPNIHPLQLAQAEGGVGAGGGGGGLTRRNDGTDSNDRDTSLMTDFQYNHAAQLCSSGRYS